MAQSKNARNRSSKLGYVYEYPSRFGSHSSMKVEINTEDDEQDSETEERAKMLTEILESLQPGEVLLEDEYGTYVTLESRLDTGLMDPARVNAVKRPRILK